MTYSIIGILGLLVLLISHRDILWQGRNPGRQKHQRYYRCSLFGVMAYYITDFLWGILEEQRWTAVLYGGYGGSFCGHGGSGHALDPVCHCLPGRKERV